MTTMPGARRRMPWAVAAFAVTAVTCVVLAALLLPGQGWVPVLFLLAVGAVAAVPLLVSPARRRPLAIAAAVLACLAVVVSLASVGLWLLPAAVLLVVSAVRG
jgi:hypothetical protein